MIDLRWQRTTAVLASVLASAAAPAQDMLAARSLAAICANCHGTNGQARGEMVSLAGRPADKTVAALEAFRNGTLPSTVMQQIAKGFSEEQIRLMAAYFAAQPPPR